NLSIVTLSLHGALPICKIEGAKNTLAKAREQSARTEKGDSIALNQSALYATVATGSLVPSATAIQWANIAVGFYTSILSTGLGRSEEHTSELQSRENLV